MYIDLEYNLRTDLKFRHKILDLLYKLKACEDVAGNIHPRMRPRAQEILLEIFKVTGGNLALFTPYYFPNFENSGPMTLQTRPYSYAMYYMPFGGSITNVGSRQIGKSTGLISKQFMQADIIPGFRTLYICPYAEQTKTYANRMKSMYQDFRFKVRGKQNEFRQNLLLREFPNSSTIKLVNALTTADAIRGNTVDGLDFDEYQNFDASLEGEILQTQTAARFPTRSYSGTSLSTESALEYRFRRSSMGMWHVKCPSCKAENNMMDIDHCHKMVQPQGLCCHKCGKPIRPETGRLIHMNPDMLKENRIGIHTAQIMLPFFTDFSITGAATRWNNILQVKEEDPLAFSREVLGIATEQGDKELTKHDIEKMCTLDSTEVDNNAKGHKDYVYWISACDWGGSDHIKEHKTKVSYTVHVIIGITRSGEFHIRHIKKYSGMDYESIGADILMNHKRFKCYAFSCDFGVGQFYINYVRDGLPDPSKVCILAYVGPNTPPISIPKQGHANQFSLNRTESLSVLFGEIKSGRIKACKDLPHVGYLYDMLNSFRVPSEKGFVYIRPATKSDDVLHAVNFGFVLGKILLKERIIPDGKLMAKINSLITAGQSTGIFNTGPGGGMFGNVVSG